MATGVLLVEVVEVPFNSVLVWTLSQLGEGVVVVELVTLNT